MLTIISGLSNRQPATYAEPFFVGLQTSHEVIMEVEGMDELRDVMVEPRSLFEAQLNFRLNSPTSIKEIDFTPNIEAFPNPFSSSVQIKIPASNDIESVQLRNINHQLVCVEFSQNADGIELTPTAMLSAGVYILRVIVDGKVIALKLVKK